MTLLEVQTVTNTEQWLSDLWKGKTNSGSTKPYIPTTKISSASNRGKIISVLIPSQFDKSPRTNRKKNECFVACAVQN